MGKLMDLLEQLEQEQTNEAAPVAMPTEAIPPSVELPNTTIWAITQMRELPFPQGYKGLPIETVIGAEAYSDWQGTTDPIKRKRRVMSWVMDTLRNETPLGQELPPFYWEVKNEKHRLIHADYEQSGLPLECGICDIPAFVDLTEDDDGQIL